MSSWYATAPVIFSNHQLATIIPYLVYNPFGLEGQLGGAGPRWTDSIWMLHGRTPLDIIAVVADIGGVVWSNNDYKYPIVSSQAVHNINGGDGEFTTTLCADLRFTNVRTKAWLTGEYDFVDSVPESGWDSIIYFSGPEVERDAWQKRCMLEYIINQIDSVQTVGGFVEKDGKVAIAVKHISPISDELKNQTLEEMLSEVKAEDFIVYDSTNQDDRNSMNWRRVSDFDIEVVIKKDQ